MDDGDGGGSRFYRPPASGEATARERGWGDGQAAVGRRSVWMNVSVHSPALPPALPAAMADDTSMRGHLATASATQLVDIVR